MFSSWFHVQQLKEFDELVIFLLFLLFFFIIARIVFKGFLFHYHSSAQKSLLHELA